MRSSSEEEEYGEIKGESDWRFLKKPWRPRRPKPRSKCWTRKKRPLRAWSTEAALPRYLALIAPEDPTGKFLRVAKDLGLTPKLKKIQACLEDSLKRSAKGRAIMRRARVGCDRMTAVTAGLGEILCPIRLMHLPAESTYRGSLSRFLSGLQARDRRDRIRMEMLNDHFTTPEETREEKEDLDELRRNLTGRRGNEVYEEAIDKLRKEYWLRGRSFPPKITEWQRRRATRDEDILFPRTRDHKVDDVA